jgi:hypothetical protein
LNKKPTNETNAKPQPVNKEAFHLLAMEIGLNEACRKLGVPIPTGKSWARRGGWKLPKRTGGRPSRALSASSASSLHPIADALDATHELEEVTKTSLAQAIAKAAKAVARKGALDVESITQLKDAIQAAEKLFGWAGKEQTSVTVNTAVQTGIVCDEATRARLIALRAEMGAPITLPAPETQPQDVQGGQAHIPEHNGGAATTEALPVGKPCPAFSAPAGATAPSDASPTYRAWLEHEKAEPEPGPNRGDELPEDDTQVPSVGL